MLVEPLSESSAAPFCSTFPETTPGEFEDHGVPLYRRARRAWPRRSCPRGAPLRARRRRPYVGVDVEERDRADELPGRRSRSRSSRRPCSRLRCRTLDVLEQPTAGRRVGHREAIREGARQVGVEGRVVRQHAEVTHGVPVPGRVDGRWRRERTTPAPETRTSDRGCSAPPTRRVHRRTPVGVDGDARHDRRAGGVRTKSCSGTASGAAAVRNFSLTAAARGLPGAVRGPGPDREGVRRCSRRGRSR